MNGRTPVVRVGCQMRERVYLGVSHCYRGVTLLQGCHIITGVSHSYRGVTLLQGCLTITGVSLVIGVINCYKGGKGGVKGR